MHKLDGHFELQTSKGTAYQLFFSVVVLLHRLCRQLIPPSTLLKMMSRKQGLITFLIVSLQLNCFITITHESSSSNTSDLSDHIGHVVYEAAYDVLASRQHQLEKYQHDGHGSSPSEELLDSTIDFLSDVVRTAGESWTQKSEAKDKHHRSPRSVPPKQPLPYGLPPVPDIGVSEQAFAHEYVPKTGIGNREVIKITGIREEPINLVIPTPTSEAFRFIRFNSSNHLLSRQRFFVNVWRFNPSRGFNFDSRYSLCQIDSRHEGQILRAEFFSRIVHHVEKLQLALVIDTPNNGFQLRSYDVDYTGCHPLNIVELKGRPVRVTFVASHYESATVVLSEGNSLEPRIDFSQSSRDTYSRVIEISVRNAVDLESFAIDGHTFLAIAYSQGVDILRLNEFLHHSMLFDAIKHGQITDIVAFQMGFDYFIGVSTSGYSQYLYEFRDGSFRMKQSFPVTKVERWVLIEVPSCREDYIVAFVRMDTVYPILLYLWDGQLKRFVLTVDNMKRYVPNFNYKLNPRSMVSVPFNHTGHLLFLDSAGSPHALSFHTVLHPVSDPLYSWTLATTGTMKNLLNRINSQELFLNTLQSNLAYSIRKNGAVSLTVPTAFRDLSARSESTVGRINGLAYFALQGSPIALGDLGFHPAEIRAGLSRLGSSVAGVQSQLKLIAFKNEHTFMTGKNVVQSAVGYALNASTLSVDAINGEPVTALLKSTYRAGYSTIVRGKKFFHSIKVERNLNSRVNGVDMGQALLLDVPQTITSRIAFGRFSARSNMRVFRVNNLDLSKDLIRTDAGNFVITTPITATNQGVTVNDLSASTISGVDVFSLSTSVLRKSVDQTLLSPLVLNQPLTANNIIANKVTNGVDLKQLEADLVRIDTPALITGSKLFMSDLPLKSSLNITGKLNGLRIPTDLFLASVPQVVTGIKRLFGIQRFEAPVVASSTVSGLRLPGDIVTLSGAEPIPYLKMMKGVDVFDDVQVSGRVDGVDVSELSSTVVKGSDGALHNPIFHSLVFVRGSVECARCLINHVKVASLASDAIMKGSRDPVVITGTKDIRSVFFAPNIEATRVNNIDLNQIATTNRHESISRLILNEVGFSNLTIQSAMIGNVNVMNLHLSFISLSNPGFIESDKNFVDTVVINDNLIVSGSLSGIFPNRDLVLKKGNQVIPGAKTFVGPFSISRSLTVHGQLLASGFIDRVNVTKLNLLRISLNTQQITKKTVQLVNCKTISVFSASINNLDMRTFVPDILLKTTGRQIITGNKKFVHTSHIFNDIDSVYGVNGIRLDQVRATAIHLNPSNAGKVSVFTAPVAFNNYLRVGDVTLFGLVNGIKLQIMVADSLTTSGNCVLTGANWFLNGVDVIGDLNAAKLNGLFLPTSVLLKTGNQVITGVMKFTRPVTTSKNVDVQGLIRSASLVKGVNIQTLDRSIMKVNRPNIVMSDLTLTEDLNVVGDIRVKGSVDGEKPSSLVHRTLLKMLDQTITGQKTVLAPLISAGNDLGLRYLNAVDFHSFIADMIFINKRNPINVLSFKNFSNQIFLKRHLAHGDRNAAFIGPINGIFVTSLAHSAVPLNQPGFIAGIKSFDSPLIISSGRLNVRGKLNGLNLLNDVLFTSLHPGKRAQVVRGMKMLNDVKALKSIDIRGLINGVSLASLARDTLYLKGSQFIQSPKILTGRFMILNNLIARRLNSMSDVSSELVTLHGHQHFSGDIVFSRTLVVGGNLLVRGAVAGQNMTDLVLHSMYKDVDQVLSGTFVFDSIFFGSDVSSTGPINGVHLDYLNRDVNSFRSNLKATDEMIKRLMTNQLKRTTRSYEQLLTNPFKIDKFVLVQELPNVFGQSYEQGSVSNGPSFGEQDYATSNSTVHKLIYNSNSRKWSTLTPLRNMAPNRVISFMFGKLRLKVNQFPVTSEGRTQLLAENRAIATLEPFLDDIQVLVNGNTAYISTLLGIDGKVKVYALNVAAGILKLTNIAVITVGPSATKVTAFVIDGELFLAVARNFRSECSVKDFGTLIFQLMNSKTFQLVQRIPVNYANHVIHYESNNQHYLLIDDHDMMNPSIKIFRKSGVGCTFEFFQSIPSGQVNDVVLLNLGTAEQMHKLLVTVNDTILEVRKQSGQSGFMESWSVPVDGGSSVQSWLTDDTRLFLLVGQTRKCTGSLVFEVLTKGSTLLPVTFKSNQCTSVVT